MISILELLFAFIFFLTFYHPLNFQINYQIIKPKANILSFKKSIAVSFMFAMNSTTTPINVSFLAFYPDWVKGVIYEGKPVYVEKIYPYIIAIGDLINQTEIISINLTETINKSCDSVLILDPKTFEPIYSDYNSTTTIVNFTANPYETYYLYCLDFSYDKYQTSLIANINLTPPMRLGNEFPLFYVCFTPQRAEDYLLLVDREYKVTKPLNCQFRDDFFVTDYVNVPRGYELGNPQIVLYKYYTLLTK